MYMITVLRLYMCIYICLYMQCDLHCSLLFAGNDSLGLRSMSWNRTELCICDHVMFLKGLGFMVTFPLPCFKLSMGGGFITVVVAQEGQSLLDH